MKSQYSAARARRRVAASSPSGPPLGHRLHLTPPGPATARLGCGGGGPRLRCWALVSVPAGSDPAGRIRWQLSVKRTRYKPQRRESSSKSFIVLLNCFCFLMVTIQSI